MIGWLILWCAVICGMLMYMNWYTAHYRKQKDAELESVIRALMGAEEHAKALEHDFMVLQQLLDSPEMRDCLDKVIERKNLTR